MHRNRFFASFFGLMMLLFSACSAPKELEYKDFKNMRLEKIGAASSAIKMDLVYYNPNNFGLQIKRTELDIFINGSFLGHSSQVVRIAVPKRANFEFPLQIDVDMKNILKNFISTTFSKEVLVKVTGRVTVGKANVFKSFAVNYEGMQQFPLF